MKIFSYFSVLILVLNTLAGNAQDVKFIKATSWEELFAKAKEENKMVLVDAYFEGCQPCKQMDDEVFPLPGVTKLMNDNFVGVKIDFMTEDFGKQLQIKYAVTGFPTFLLLNNEGQLVSRFSGYQEGDKFESLLKEAITNVKNRIVLKGYSTNLKVNYPSFYTDVFTERKGIAPDTLAFYLKQKDITIEVNAMPLLMTGNFKPEVVDTFLNNYYRLEEMYGKEIVWPKRISILTARLKSEILQRDDAKFMTYLDKIKPLFSKADWPYGQLDIAEAYYYKLHKDNTAFFKFAAGNPNDDDNKIRYMSMSISPANKPDFMEWMKKVITENSRYEVLRYAVSAMQSQDLGLAKRYARWGIKKAKLINKSVTQFEEVLKHN